MSKSEKVVYDLSKLNGLNFRIKNDLVIKKMLLLKGNLSTNAFIFKYKLEVSENRLNNWINKKYGIPLDFCINLFGSKILKFFKVSTFYSGNSSSYCQAILPFSPSIHLMYLIGAIIGDGSLSHPKNGSYLIRFEMVDTQILSMIQKIMKYVFSLEKNVLEVNRSDGRKSYVLKYSNKIVYYFLYLFFDLKPRKTKTVSIKFLETLNKSEKLALLLGLYHTDGSIVNEKIRFYTSSENLKEDLMKLLFQIGYEPHTYTYKRNLYDPEYHISVSQPKRLILDLERLESLIKKPI